MNTSFAAGVRWDLSDLYDSPGDPRIEEDLKGALESARAFEGRWRPFFEAPERLTAPDAAKMVDEYERVLDRMTRPGVYANLHFSVTTHRPESGAFLQGIQTRLTDIQSHLVFLEVSWNRLDGPLVERLVTDPALARRAHFLGKLRTYSPHTLGEPEEKILAVKANTGVHAFQRLFDETVNNIEFLLETPDGPKTRNESQVLALLHSADRAERRRASESLAGGLERHARLLTYTYNMVLADHRDTLKLRSYVHPMDPMNLSNEVSREGVLTLLERVREAYPLAQRYYRLKRSLLGLDEFLDYDRYAPLSSDGPSIGFDECRTIVLEGYDGFHPDAGRIARLFFDRRWIDAEVRDGKRGGGFCCQTTPDLHPYILVNYTGSLRDVQTVAHEIGHGLHQYLAGRRVGLLESDAPLTMAETASVFGEMLVFEKLLGRVSDRRRRLELLCGQIDDHVATVFRQVAMTEFELAAHEAGRAEGELSDDRLSALWLDANSRLYGDSVRLTGGYRHGWKYIPHFVHSPFYCYAYAYAQLVVLSLYARYRQEGPGFAGRYFEMLSLGGSKRPGEIAAICGLDLEAKGFWDEGIRWLGSLVEEAERLAGDGRG